MPKAHSKILKRVVLAVVLVLLLVIAVKGIRAIGNWYSNQKPWDYPDSVWVSEDPCFRLTVDADSRALCVVGSGAGAHTYAVHYRGNNIFFCVTDESGVTEQISQGGAEYSSERCVITFQNGWTIPDVSETPVYRLELERQS